MKYIRILIIILVLCIFLNGVSIPTEVKGDAPYLINLPVVSNFYPEQRLGPFLGKVTCVATDPNNPGVIFAGTWNNGVFKSSDHGSTWSPVNQGLTNLVIQSLAIDPTNSQNVYAGVYYDGTTDNGVFKSVDGGMTWHVTGKIENTYNGSPVSRPIIYALAVDPSNSNVIYAGTRMSNLVPGQTIYGGGGVFKTSNQGQTWVPVNRNLPANDLYVYDLAINPDNPSRVYAALHVSGPFVSSDGGDHWSSLATRTDVDLSGRAILVDSGNSRQVFYGTWHNQGVYYSGNQGGLWYQKGVVGVGGVLGLAQDPSNDAFLIANVWQKSSNDPPSRLYFSSDQGDNWSGNDREAYYQIVFDPFDGSLVYGGTDNGVKISRNRGNSWGYSNWGLVGYSTPSVAINPVSPNVIYAAVFNLGVEKSTDRGVSWHFINTGLPSDLTARSLAIDPLHPDILYLTSDDAGVFRTTDAGANWSLTGGYPAALNATIQPDLFQNRASVDPEVFVPNEALEKTALTSIVPGTIVAIAPDSSVVLVGTNGRGILRFNGTSGWSQTNLVSGAFQSLLFDVATPGRVSAGASGADGSLFVSTNLGATWVSSATGLSGRTVYALCQSPDHPEMFWAGTDAGVYLTQDNGASWILAGLADMPVTAISAHSNIPGRILAGTPNYIYMSSDYGSSWVKEEAQLDHLGIQEIVQDPASPNFVYLATRFAGIIRANP